MPLSVRKVLAPLRSFLDQIFKLTKLPVNDRHGQNLINDCILSAFQKVVLVRSIVHYINFVTGSGKINSEYGSTHQNGYINYNCRACLCFDNKTLSRKEKRKLKTSKAFHFFNNKKFSFHTPSFLVELNF